jgi:hypothetical protein
MIYTGNLEAHHVAQNGKSSPQTNYLLREQETIPNIMADESIFDYSAWEGQDKFWTEKVSFLRSFGYYVLSFNK